MEAVVDRADGCTAVQRDFDRLEERADRSLMKFSKGRAKSCFCRRIIPGTSMAGTNLL